MRTFVKGVSTGLHVESTAAPAAIIVQAYRPAGTMSIPVRGTRRFTLTAGTVLQFGLFQVTVAEDLEVGAGTTQELQLTEPLPVPFAASATSLPVGELLRVHGTGDTDFNINSRTVDATPAVGSSRWSRSAIVTQGWEMQRRGNFRPHDPAFQVIQAAARAGSEVRVVRMLPDEADALVTEDGGTAIVTNFRVGAPADGIVDASWTFLGQGEPTTTTGAPADFEFMLDFTEADNSANTTFI